MSAHRIAVVLAFALAFHRVGVSIGGEFNVMHLGAVGVGFFTLIGFAFGAWTASKLKG